MNNPLGRFPTLRDWIEAIFAWAWALLNVIAIMSWRFRLTTTILVIIIVVWVVQCWRGSEIRPSQVPEFYTLYIPLVAKDKPSPKKGVGLAYPICSDAYRLNVSWQYGWGTHPIQCEGLYNIPMIWGRNQVLSTISDSDWLMGFNEPERPEQANLRPGEAAELWRIIEERFPDRKLVSPATMGGLGQIDSALNWMREWRTEYQNRYGTNPRIDAIALHLYGWGSDNFIGLLSRYAKLATEFGVSELWITEFAMLAMDHSSPCWGNTFEDQVVEAHKFLMYLEQDERVTHYAWFANRVDVNEWYALKPSWCNSPLIKWGTDELSGWGRFYSGSYGE